MRVAASFLILDKANPGVQMHASQGLPEEGIAAGTRWDDIPAEWACPDCGVAKADFDMVEI